MIGAAKPSRNARKWVLILYWIVIFSLTHWPDIDRFRPEGGWPIDNDRVVHALAYGGWAVLWFWVLAAGGRRVSRGAVAWIVIGGSAYAAFDEMTQAIVDRHPDIVDFACDALGLWVTLALMMGWQRWRELRTLRAGVLKGAS